MAVFDQAKTVITVGFFPRLKQNIPPELTEKTKTFCKIAKYIKKYEQGTDLRNKESTQAMNSWKEIVKCLGIFLGQLRGHVLFQTGKEAHRDNCLCLIKNCHMLYNEGYPIFCCLDLFFLDQKFAILSRCSCHVRAQVTSFS